MDEDMDSKKNGDSRRSSNGTAHQVSDAESDEQYEAQFETLEEERLVKLMRASVVKLEPELKDVDDATLRRFLRARQKKVDKATKMFVDHFRWRRTFVPLGYIPEEEVQNELDAEKVFLQGNDKAGRPIGLIIAAKHDAYKRNLNEFKRYCVYNFDKCVASMAPGEEKFTIIVDLQGLGYKNLDPRGWTCIFDFLQGHYPERIRRIFMIHVPYIFYGAWKLVSPFIDKVTRDKIVFVGDKVLLETLLEEIDVDQLPKVYGGRKELVPIQFAVTPNWPPKHMEASQTS
ncbi:phosphatidylinositol/phosphatidylcholine transfer protein [Marchantia polymorpha subsp. ruderalis]|uniref:CRAL-TRIO domain-containing protein n=2 Tax=Marchantia polymorpha TaxID=3197 RepID=A0A176W5Q4_MARPO|nr:hypothetical protein AXG93_3309s1280 [Marchantia polymorpha subsp. ruderalis]PTQ32742.1 hypothetical protein MARPO_0095s0006 [Marchantia polymorpha]BBN11156.1 hypothetical protein Mp_5g09540 [Marchantia polymorpha subsp. ruderalis]|eukprot:PTQ32742.1 hypothetical protein MARPO_0095s0006 [Marchantia polymorpha]